MGYPANHLADAEVREKIDWLLNGLGLGEAVAACLEKLGLVATRLHEPFPGQIARVRIDVYGESASEVEATLLEFAQRCDAASQATEVSYGECVIERNLQEVWGETYSWKGRLTLHPTIGTLPSSERAAQVLDEAAKPS